MQRSGHSITVYHKTDFSHCAFPNEEVAEVIRARARCIIRIEVYLQGNLLRSRGWNELESWRKAYAEGRYEAIFREFVRGLFNLEAIWKGEIKPGVVLRHKVPRQEALQRLTGAEHAIVISYLAETPVDELPGIKDAKHSHKAKSKWKKLILNKLRIDIAIPWPQHQALRHADLERLLRYPGDYHPDADVVKYCFCKENWPALLHRLRALYHAAVRHHPHQSLSLTSDLI